MLKNIPILMLSMLISVSIVMITFDINIHADANDAGAVATNSSSQSSTASTSNSSEKAQTTTSTSTQPPKPVHHYDHVSNFKKVSYDVNLKNGAHKAYRGGPANTSFQNMRSNDSISGSDTKRVHVSAQATVNGVQWDKVAGYCIKDSGVDAQTHYLRVPLIGQRPQLPTGCEITAVTMMLKYKGAKVNKMMLSNEMPRSSNPNKGFVGNPRSSAGQLIYPLGLMKLVAHYAGSAKNMTGASLDQIKAQIQNGHPVVVWVANVDHFPNHALTVYGYDRHYVYYNDPWLNKPDRMTPQTFQIHRQADAMRAISY